MAVGFEFFRAAPGSAEQDACISMLAVCFDEFVQFRKEFGDRMPFTEISFIARCSDGRIAGHAGVMPMKVYGGEGKILKLAGLASVAVHPDFRRQGIAAELCRMAARQAAEEGFDDMPLYTGLNPVYRSCGWKDYDMPSVTLVNPSPAECRGKSGRELTEEEKEIIIAAYEKSPAFPGKVLREKDTLFHSWERMFRESFFTWYPGKEGYALAYEGVLAEAASEKALPDVCSFLKKAFLSPEDPVVPQLIEAGWQIEAQNDNSPDWWHGENAMIRESLGKAEDAALFFSLADKF